MKTESLIWIWTTMEEERLMWVEGDREWNTIERTIVIIICILLDVDPSPGRFVPFLIGAFGSERKNRWSLMRWLCECIESAAADAEWLTVSEKGNRDDYRHCEWNLGYARDRECRCWLRPDRHTTLCQNVDTGMICCPLVWHCERNVLSISHISSQIPNSKGFGEGFAPLRQLQ